LAFTLKDPKKRPSQTDRQADRETRLEPGLDEQPAEAPVKAPAPVTAPADPIAAKLRPMLNLGRAEQNAPVASTGEVNATVPAPQPTETPYSNYQLDSAEMEDRMKADKENPYIHKHRKRSILMGVLEGAGGAARASIASGHPSLAATLGGAAGGAIGGAANPRLADELENDRRKGELNESMGFTLQKRAKEADINYREVQPAIETARIGATENYNQARLRIQAAVAAGHMTQGQADIELKKAAQKETNRHNTEIETIGHERNAKLGAGENKIPDSFYRSKDKDQVKNQALDEVLGSGNYSNLEFRPEVLDAYGGDINKINSAIRGGALQPAEIFTDPRKGASFQQELAKASRRIEGEAQEHDTMLQSTAVSNTYTDDKGQSRPTHKITQADFEKTFADYAAKMKAAPDDTTRQRERAKFQKALQQVRLIGQ
jgi:hypothetical protein